jgi:hypothetical protein
MALSPAATELKKQIKAAGFASRLNKTPNIIEDIDTIVRMIQSKSSCYWHAGEAIPDTDAVVLGISLITNYWSACSKADFQKAKEISEGMLTNAGS